MKAMVLCVIASEWCIAQTIYISGTVKDSSGEGISGATVKLELADLSTTTGVDGSFTLTDETGTGTNNYKANLSGIDKISFKNNTISFAVEQRSSLVLEVYSFNGRKIIVEHHIYDSGNHSIVLPQLSTGVHLFRIIICTYQYRFTSATLVQTTLFSKLSFEKSLSSDLPAKQVSAQSYTDDVLAVTKEGLLNYRIAIRNPDTNAITIKMLPNAGNVTDIDGNVYQSVRLGNQVWTVENLKTTKYNDGTAITYIPDSASWLKIYLTRSTTDAYCFYGTDDVKMAKYGLFYNWYTVNTGKLAPKGWRVPTDADWDTLQNYLIANGCNYDGTTTGNKIAKSMAAQCDWDSSTIEGAVGNDLYKNNLSGFSVLPGGLRHWGGSYYSLFLERNLTYLWSSTGYDSLYAWHRYLDCHHNYLDRVLHHKNTGFPIRIVRDFK